MAHSEAEALQRVLHNTLSDLHEEVTSLHRYGAAYIAVRQTIIMEKACALLGFRLGHKKNDPITVASASVTQADLIKYFSFGAGNTFWNARSVYALAVRTRDFIEQVGLSDRQAHQTDTLHIIRHLLDAVMLVLPSGAGPASSATSISRPVFEARCTAAMGTNARTR